VRIDHEVADATPQHLLTLSQQYKDVFAFGLEEMPGISPTSIEHHLNIDTTCKPVAQKKRTWVQNDVQPLQRRCNGCRRLVHPGISIPSVDFKHCAHKEVDGTRRMCIDFIDLNKVCPKDSYPLLKIDKAVDANAGDTLLSFIDAFFGYHQIPLNSDDQEKMAFITNMGLCCYQVMPFRLKNAGLTYHRLVKKLFRPLIGKNMEVYADDMIVKSKKDA